MPPFLKGVVTTVVVFILIGGIALVAFIRAGVSARPEPGSLETFAALTVRNLAIGHAAGATINPTQRTADVIAGARAHFADHCAICHANDGSGKTEMGAGFFPKVPDMRLPRTQSLTDAQLFYIIEQGVRMTGMPAWGTGTAAGEEASWHLVHFIRHLPEISESEVAEMEKMNPISPDEARQRLEEEAFLRGDDAPASPAPPAAEHKHH